MNEWRGKGITGLSSRYLSHVERCDVRAAGVLIDRVAGAKGMRFPSIARKTGDETPGGLQNSINIDAPRFSFFCKPPAAGRGGIFYPLRKFSISWKSVIGKLVPDDRFLKQIHIVFPPRIFGLPQLPERVDRDDGDAHDDKNECNRYEQFHESEAL